MRGLTVDSSQIGLDDIEDIDFKVSEVDLDIPDIDFKIDEEETEATMDI